MKEEDIKSRIIKILSQFRAEELGNRLSQFAMNALILSILAEFEKEEKKKPESG